MAALVIRLALFAIVGLIGWLLGGTVGVFAGIGLDLFLLSEQPSGPGATVTSLVWGTGFIGAIAGMVGAVMWLGSRLGRNAT